MEVFCSTGGFEDMPFYETGKLFSKLGINKIELSAGVPSKDVVKQLTNLSQDADLMLHNYFPPPEIPFVLNLASKDEVVIKKSVELFIDNFDNRFFFKLSSKSLVWFGLL